VALVAAAALLYSLVRGLTDDRVDVAFSNAERVMSVERRLGIFIEPDVQAAVLGNDLVVDLANAVYIAYWPIVVGALGWLLIWRPASYRLYRNALLVSGLLSLAVFALFPLAPPRFLPEHGFADTIATHSAGYREFNASPLVNEYAAMPSLHLGWVLLVGIALVTLSRSTGVRVAGAMLPALMFASIVLTGNHYILDGIVGSVIVLTGLAAAATIAAMRTPNATPRGVTLLTISSRLPLSARSLLNRPSRLTRRGSS
jgi:membrane-associated phospholipid phosphatase